MTQEERLIELIKRSVDEFIKNVMQHCVENGLEMLSSVEKHIAGDLFANGVIVPPIKPMQKCVVLPTIENGLQDITEMKCIGYSISHDSAVLNLIDWKNKLYQPAFGRFGKTVFLTKEEAEAAPKEREVK